MPFPSLSQNENPVLASEDGFRSIIEDDKFLEELARQIFDEDILKQNITELRRKLEPANLSPQKKNKLDELEQLIFINNVPGTLLDWLLSYEITIEQIISVFMTKRGGVKNLSALQKLFQTREFYRLKDAGFTVQQIISILSHNEGSQKLNALIAILNNSISADYGKTQTQLQSLISSGFEPEDIISVLNHDAGPIHLKALVGLLNPSPVSNHTQLQDLKTFGFELKNIISVLSHDGGPRNLQALVGLLNFSSTSKPTPLQDLQGFGFELEDIISVLIHGGPHNLKILFSLLKDQTQLERLITSGFKPRYIVSILSKPAGRAKNIAALVQVTANKLDSRWIMSIYTLANKSSTSSQLNTLNDILMRETLYAELLAKPELFDRLCISLAQHAAKRLKRISITSINELSSFCNPNKRQSTNLRKRANSSSTIEKPPKKRLPTNKPSPLLANHLFKQKITAHPKQADSNGANVEKTYGHSC